jgi:hypothetical protein
MTSVLEEGAMSADVLIRLNRKKRWEKFPFLIPIASVKDEKENTCEHFLRILSSNFT